MSCLVRAQMAAPPNTSSGFMTGSKCRVVEVAVRAVPRSMCDPPLVALYEQQREEGKYGQGNTETRKLLSDCLAVRVSTERPQKHPDARDDDADGDRLQVEVPEVRHLALSQ